MDATDDKLGDGGKACPKCFKPMGTVRVNTGFWDGVEDWTDGLMCLRYCHWLEAPAGWPLLVRRFLGPLHPVRDDRGGIRPRRQSDPDSVPCGRGGWRPARPATFYKLR